MWSNEQLPPQGGSLEKISVTQSEAPKLECRRDSSGEQKDSSSGEEKDSSGEQWKNGAFVDVPLQYVCLEAQCLLLSVNQMVCGLNVDQSKWQSLHCVLRPTMKIAKFPIEDRCCCAAEPSQLLNLADALPRG